MVAELWSNSLRLVAKILCIYSLRFWLRMLTRFCYRDVRVSMLFFELIWRCFIITKQNIVTITKAISTDWVTQ